MEKNAPTQEVSRDYKIVTTDKYHLKIMYSYFMWLMKQNQIHNHVLETKIEFSEMFNPHGNRVRAFCDMTHEEYRNVILSLYSFIENFSKISGLAINFEPSETEGKVVDIVDKKELIVSNPDIEMLLNFYRYILYLFIEPFGDDTSRRITLDQILHGDMSDFGSMLDLSIDELNALRKHITKDVSHIFETTVIHGA